MAQYNDELLLAEEDSNSVFGDYLSDTESEQEKCEVNVRRGNKGKQIEYPHHHHCRHKSCTDGEVFLDSQVNNNSTYVYGSSPSTSSTPVRYRSRNSSVRSIQTVDCCMPSAERDGIVFRNELFSQDRDFDSSSDEDDAFIRSHKPEAPLHRKYLILILDTSFKFESYNLSNLLFTTSFRNCINIRIYLE